jgi:hypothetical protein
MPDWEPTVALNECILKYNRTIEKRLEPSMTLPPRMEDDEEGQEGADENVWTALQSTLTTIWSLKASRNGFFFVFFNDVTTKFLRKVSGNLTSICIYVYPSHILLFPTIDVFLDE